MSFRKTASVTVLATAVPAADGKGLQKTASFDAVARSYYIDGSSKIDVGSLLGRVAEKYAISANPGDYIYEAIRANTTNVPNENHDAFHQSELLRFDLRMGMPVYQSYVGKPHHVNHRTAEPKTARGVIVDVHYNDATPALAECPTVGCGNKTAERSNRDATGIHCSKCGSVVKDEFVEALVAVDTKKDPVFAEGVRTGQLKSSSMGCTCAYTTCNVCEHVATSRPEFCEHIKAGNKGTLWAKEAGRNWRRIEARAAEREFAQRKLVFSSRDLCYLRTSDGFEVRKAFENCGDVEYDELSRVDQPADPKALQREILKAASAGVPTAEELRAESEALIKAATAPTQSKRAKLSDSLAQELLAMPADEARAEVEQLLASGKTSDVIINIEDSGAGGEPRIEMNTPGAEPIAPDQPEPNSIDEFTDEELNEPDKDDDMSSGELGIIPPGASKQGARMYAKSYADWAVEITAKGNARVVSPRGPVMLVKAAAEPKNDEERKSFGREVLSHLFDHGLVKTAERYNAKLDAKFAQVVDYAINDMKGFDDHYMFDSILENGEQNDMAGVDKADAVPEKIGDGEDNSDMAEEREESPVSTLQDGSADHAEREELQATPAVTEDAIADMRDERAAPPSSALDDELHDHKERVARLEKENAALKKLMAAKLEASKRQASNEIGAARKAERETIFRALRIVAKRHARNLELSPLKEAFGVVLASERTIGHDTMTGEPLEYAPLPQDLVLHLVEAAWKDGGDAQTEELIRRASELAGAGDEYLKAAEADIAKIAHTVPAVTSVTLQTEDSDVTLRAAELRQAAKQGSMALPVTGSDAPPANDKRTKIQAAISGGLTSKRSQFRPN